MRLRHGGHNGKVGTRQDMSGQCRAWQERPVAKAEQGKATDTRQGGAGLDRGKGKGKKCRVVQFMARHFWERQGAATSGKAGHGWVRLVEAGHGGQG